jgi:SAM-dependent methyltransferase
MTASRCVFLNTYYGAFLSEFYSRAPEMLSASYAIQKAALQAEFFGDSDFYSEALKQAGWPAEDIIVNCEPLQHAWARENHYSGEILDIAVEQIKRISPQVVYIQDLHLATESFLTAIRPHTELIAGQIACPVSPGMMMEGLDLIFTSFPHYTDRFRAQGLTAYYHPLSFEPRVLLDAAEQERIYPVTFVGGISSLHGKSTEILETIALSAPVEFWGYGVESLPSVSPIRSRHHGEVWGRTMFSVLGKSFITINRHVDVAENYANNMRLFEATGCGTLLITDYKDNLQELFSIGEEVVTYRSAEECVALIKYYLAHPEEGRRIALAGQMRTLKDHTYTLRMEKTAEILERHLRSRREADRYPAPDMANISCGYEEIESSAISAEMEEAWQSDTIPAKQRALVEHQLADMYRGNIAVPFQVIKDILNPIVFPRCPILEIGCASGYYYEIMEYLLKTPLSYTGVDYSWPLVAMARDYYDKPSFIAADGGILPFRSGGFPIVISSCILLHVADYGQHIKETARVSEKYVVAHRTPVCRKRPTRRYRKQAYGVETLEIVFHEEELLSLFAENGLKQINRIEYHADPDRDFYEITYLFQHDNIIRRSAHPRAITSMLAHKALTWDDIRGLESVRLYAGDIPDRNEYEGLIGLSINVNDDRHIRHDITAPFPLPDNSVDSFQAEDVFEHIPYDRLAAVVDEIYRVLKPGGLFRLSVPDYGCDVLRERSVRNNQGDILFDPGGGGTPVNPGHLWFPRFDKIAELLSGTNFTVRGGIDFRQYYTMNNEPVIKPIDYTKGHVDRTPDFDKRVQNPRRPMSLVVDLTKSPSDASDRGPDTE